MKAAYLVALFVSAVIGVSCSSSDGYSCGPGTRASGTECVVAAGSAGIGNAPEAGASGVGGVPGEPVVSAGAGGSAAAEGGAAGEGPVLITTQTLDCGSRNITGATLITEPITRDATWSGVVYLPQGLTVRNEPTLTILPGTKVIVGKAGVIELGSEDSRPLIRALGTVVSPITFCGETSAAGYWNGVVFRGHVDPGSTLRNVLISDAGAADAALTLEMPLTVQGVQVRNSAMIGVKTVGFGADSVALTVAGSGLVALTATASNGVELPPQSSITGNGVDAIDIGFSTFDSSVTLRNFGVPYRQFADVNGSKAQPPPVVTIEPGVVFEIRHQTLLNFGTATVHALGTSLAPIILQGLPCAEDPGVCNLVPADNGHAPGGRVQLSGSTDDQLAYVEMHSMGWTKQRTIPPLDYVPFGALTIATDTPLKADHLKLTFASGWGVQLSGTGAFTADSQGIDVNTLPRFSTFTPNALSLACGFLMSLPADTKVSGEPRTNVACYGTGTLSSTWPAAAGPYILSGFQVDAGGAVTMQPGTVLRFLYRTTLRVKSGGSLSALGTLAAPIQFVEDTTPYSMIGNWNGLIVESGGSAALDYVLVDSAGANQGANITAQGPLTLTHSTISNSLNWGIQKAAADATDYLTPNLFANNVTGDVGNL